VCGVVWGRGAYNDPQPPAHPPGVGDTSVAPSSHPTLQAITPRASFLTRFHHVVHGGEALEHPGADGAQDEDCRQVGVADEGAPQDPAPLVLAVDVAGDDTHELVGQGDAGVLGPPPVDDQGDIKTCTERQRVGGSVWLGSGSRRGRARTRKAVTFPGVTDFPGQEIKLMLSFPLDCPP